MSACFTLFGLQSTPQSLYPKGYRLDAISTTMGVLGRLGAYLNAALATDILNSLSKYQEKLFTVKGVG